MSEVVDIDDNAGGYKSTLLICIAPYNIISVHQV